MQRLLNLAQSSWHLGSPGGDHVPSWDTVGRTHSLVVVVVAVILGWKVVPLKESVGRT